MNDAMWGLAYVEDVENLNHVIRMQYNLKSL